MFHAPPPKKEGWSGGLPEIKTETRTSKKTKQQQKNNSDHKKRKPENKLVERFQVPSKPSLRNKKTFGEEVRHEKEKEKKNGSKFERGLY